MKEEEGVSTSFPRIQKYAKDLRSEEAVIGGNIVGCSSRLVDRGGPGPPNFF